MILSYTQLALAAAVLLFGSYLNGAVGFGMGMIASPLLVLIHPLLVPGPVLLFGMFVTGAGIWRDRRSLEFAGTGWALAGRFPGSFMGAAVVALLSPALLGVSVGLSVLGGVLIGALGRVPGRSALNLFWAGLMSGFMSTVAAVGGPPIVLMYQSAPPAQRRAALSLFFFIGTVMSLVALLALGAMTHESLQIFVLLFPVVVAGYLFGVFGPPIRHERTVKQIALLVCAGAGLAVLLRSGYAMVSGH